MNKYNKKILIRYLKFETSYKSTDFKILNIISIVENNNNINVSFKCKIKNYETVNDFNVDWVSILPINLKEYLDYQEKELLKIRIKKIKKLMK